MRRLLALPLLVAACSSHAGSSSPGFDGGGILIPLDASFDVGASMGSDRGGASDGGTDAGPSRFVTEVVSFTQGTCAGFGADALPGIVYGPPVGLGALAGSTDVVSLGGGGSIIVGFAPNSIVDGPGDDFIVFENPFDYGDGDRYVEPGEVAVSDDGVHWTAFPCTDTTQAEPDGGWGATQCGGMNLVYSNPYMNPRSAGEPPISPFDVENAGGDHYDLATIGVKSAKYVRVRNVVDTEECPDAGTDAEPRPIKNGFDLDAIAILHGAL